MSEQSVPSPETQELLIQPIGTEREDYVENHFALNPEDPNPQQQPDYTTLGRMRKFLIDRFRPEAQAKPGYNILVDDGEEIVTKTEFKRWWYFGLEKRQFWTAVLGVNLLLNTAINADEIESAGSDGVEIVRNYKDKAEDWFGIGRETVPCDTAPATPGTTVTSTETVRVVLDDSTDQPVGESYVNPDGLDRMFDVIDARVGTTEEVKGTSVTELEKVKVLGLASDEWRAALNSGLGQDDNGNEILVYERLVDYVDSIGQRLDSAGISRDVLEVDPRSGEAVLSADNLLNLYDAIISENYTVDQAFDIYNNPATRNLMPPSLLGKMHRFIGDNRGTTAELTFSTTIITPAGEIILKCLPKEEPDGTPENPNHDYDPELLPLLLLPIPLFEDKLLRRVRQKWVEVPPELPNPEFLKLYPQAKDEFDNLVQEAWAYSRKYQYLMREDNRIQAMYKLDYVDSEGQPRYLNAMFIDHEPTPEELVMAGGILQKATMIQGGRIGSEVDMIAFYPEDNAGTEHGNPKKVGLGQDIQFGSSTVGLAYPALRLAEMHLPTGLTKQEDLEGFEKASWILAHELTGHFSGVNEEDNHLTEIDRDVTTGLVIYQTNNRFDKDVATAEWRRAQREEDEIGRVVRHGRIRRAYNILTGKEELPPSEVNQSRWRVIRRVQNARGDMVDLDDTLRTSDPRVPEGIAVDRETGFPTGYSSTHPDELWAEAMAQYVTNAEIPYSEAPDGALVVTIPGFNQGYGISSRMRQLIADRIGSDANSRTMRFVDEDGEEIKSRQDWTHWYGRPEQDPQIRALMNEARRIPMPPEIGGPEQEGLLHIFTGSRI